MSENLSDIIREFFVDFLGSLIPGFLFLVVAIPLLVGWGVIVWKIILGLMHSTATIPNIFHFAEVFRFEILLLLLALSYVMGAIFHRQDPKTPDQKSAEYILKKSTVEELSRAVIQPLSLPQGRLKKKEARELAKGGGGQFPYSHLKEYLSLRGLEHLAAIVPWKWSDQGHQRFRTKMFINLLKIRLNHVAPDKCNEIIRNEAHVRMMSSVWYAARALKYLTLTSVPPFLCGIFVLAGRRSPEFWGLFVATFAVALGASCLQLYIRKFFHYQRVREIVYVLETAYVASKDHPEILSLVEQPGLTGRSRAASSSQ